MKNNITKESKWWLLSSISLEWDSGKLMDRKYIVVV